MRADPYVHEPPNLLLTLRERASGETREFSLCTTHRTEFARYEILTGFITVARSPVEKSP